MPDQRASFDRLLEHTPALLGVASIDGRFVRVSRTWETFLGLPLEDIEGADFMAFVHPDDRSGTQDAMAQLDQNQPVIDFENRYRCANGEYRRLSWRSDRGPDGFIYFTAEDITEARRLYETLEASNERLSQVADIAGIGGWEVDLVNQTVFWDETTRRIHEVPEDYVPTLEAGVRFYDGLAAERIAEAVRDGIELSRPWDVVLPLITYTGRRIYVRASGRPLKDNGVVTRLTGTFQDVTEAQEHAEELERSRAAAQSANEAKSRFLATMSHEIRTPLNGVLGMAQLLQRTSLDDRQSFYVKTLRESGTALSGLVDDVLDLARIEAGELHLVDAPFNLAELIMTSRSAVAAQAAEKGLLVSASISPDLPETVVSDAGRLKQVVINLLGNAVKFTHTGQVALSAEPAARGLLRVTVTDTGPGVPDDLKAAIFERFTQADSSDTRTQGGAGLGLAICQDLVTLAGGRLGVSDAPGGGAQFWFEWPIGAAQSGSDDVTEEPAPSGLARVLVAEDNLVNAMMLHEALSQAGYTVIQARNGLEAVELALAKKPDVILLDVHMPELNGLEALKRIREQASGATPILVLTADVSAETRARVEDAQPTAAFTKPVDLEAVLRAVSDAAPPPEKLSA